MHLQEVCTKLCGLSEANGHAESIFGVHEAADSSEWDSRHDGRGTAQFGVTNGNESGHEYAECGRYDRDGEYAHRGTHGRLRRQLSRQLCVHAWSGPHQPTQSTVAENGRTSHGWLGREPDDWLVKQHEHAKSRPSFDGQYHSAWSQLGTACKWPLDAWSWIQRPRQPSQHAPSQPGAIGLEHDVNLLHGQSDGGQPEPRDQTESGDRQLDDLVPDLQARWPCPAHQRVVSHQYALSSERLQM